MERTKRQKRNTKELDEPLSKLANPGSPEEKEVPSLVSIREEEVDKGTPSVDAKPSIEKAEASDIATSQQSGDEPSDHGLS